MARRVIVSKLMDFISTGLRPSLRALGDLESFAMPTTSPTDFLSEFSASGVDAEKPQVMLTRSERAR
jgi:hypothetical protein